MAGTTRRLIVEVAEARNLVPKDGQGRSSPYVVIDYYGQRRRTKTVIKDLNPTWNETFEFTVGKPSDVFGDMLELDVYHDRHYGPTRRSNFLGRIRLSSSQFVRKGEEALIYYPLEKKNLFSWVQGDIGLRIYYFDEVIIPPTLSPTPSPTSPPPLEPVEEEKTEEKTEQSAEAKEEIVTPESNSEPTKEAVTEQKQDRGSAPSVEPESAAEAEKPSKPAQQTDEAQAAADPSVGPPPEDSQAKEANDDIAMEPATVNASNLTSSQSDTSPQPEVTITRSVSVSMPDMKVSGINPPQPIIRTVSEAASYTSDISTTPSIERSSFDLVEKMHYLFVRVLKARSLPTNGDPVVKISTSNTHIVSKPARKTAYFEWDQIFAFVRDPPDLSSSILEISVWDPSSPSSNSMSDADERNFLGGICFDVTEIPLRDPPDSPLAPQWYRLEGGGAHNSDLMLATWIGTQADDSFPDAWKSDTAGNTNSKAKVYISPKLWYLRVTILEAQDVLPMKAVKEASFQIKSQLGFQVQKTKIAVTRNGAPSWNEDLLFVAAEPFSDNHLIFSLENRQPKGPVTLGVTSVPLTAIERRVDDRKVVSRWFNFEDTKNEQKVYKGRAHLRLCFDGGYHVMDEAANVCSDYRPTARQLWKPPVGIVELGIIGCKNLLPIKTVDCKGSTDAYTVAKYGPKWVRTRTVSDSLDPKWNEQYTWKVYDPCTVLTIGVFDSWEVFDMNDSDGKQATRPDCRIGKVRIRISTLETGKVYRNIYPLLLLGNNGVKKMGELELAVRFIRTTPTLDFLHVYSQPLLPLMHHIKPLGMVHQDMLRNTVMKIMAVHLSRSEPPLKNEVVRYMLDADSHAFSMRKVRANWLRIINVLAGLIDIIRWIDDTRVWKNSTATILVHALMVMLVWFPDLIIPTLAFYMFVIGAWNYRFRLRYPLPHFDPKISLADVADHEELDEEFDTVPSTRSPETVRARYDRLRCIGTRVQRLLGDFATQGERIQALVTWRDPHATRIFVGLCFVVAMCLYIVPLKMVAMAFVFYYFRHPIFRDQLPSPALNFLRRLPSLCDRIM